MLDKIVDKIMELLLVLFCWILISIGSGCFLIGFLMVLKLNS